MLVLCEPPQKSSAHSVSPRFADAFERAGLRCRFAKLGPEWPLAALLRHRVPNALEIYYACLRVLTSRPLARLQEGDIAWVYTNTSAVNPFRPMQFLDQIHARKAKHVFVLMDGWFQKPLFLGATEAHVARTDLTAAITPRLVDDVRERFPEAPVALFEEAIDTDIVRPGLPSASAGGLPRIVWTGSAGNLRSLLELAAAPLAALHRLHPFVLRVVGASGGTIGAYPFPVERVPFSMETEGAALSVGRVALSWSRDVPYVDRKGHYKLKTYLAAGVPVVANPKGYATSIVQTGVSGYLVADEAELIQRLLELLRSPDKARAMGENARRSAVERFSYDVQARIYIDTLARYFPREIELATQQRRTP